MSCSDPQDGGYGTFSATGGSACAIATVLRVRPIPMAFNPTWDDLLSAQSWVTPPQSEGDDLLSRLKSLRSLLAKLRYQEEKAELRRRAVKSSQSSINSILLGGSAKCLIPRDYSTPPLAIQSPSNPDIVSSSPAEVKQFYITYFLNLFRRGSRPPHPKPWLNTESICRIRQRTS
jgi:hypothetical protein